MKKMFLVAAALVLPLLSTQPVLSSDEAVPTCMTAEAAQKYMDEMTGGRAKQWRFDGKEAEAALELFNAVDPPTNFRSPTVLFALLPPEMDNQAGRMAMFDDKGCMSVGGKIRLRDMLVIIQSVEKSGA